MGLLDFLKKKKTFQETTGTPVSAMNVSPNTSTQGNGVSIIIEQLTEIGSISINKLTEIKNSHIVTAINSLLHSTVNKIYDRKYHQGNQVIKRRRIVQNYRC